MSYDVRDIIILCHGDYGLYLVKDLIKQFGGLDNLKVFPLYPDDFIDLYKKKVESYIKNINKKILIISDLRYGSTSNVALSLAIKYNIEVICNLSLETLLISDNVRKKYTNDEEISNEICNQLKTIEFNLSKLLENK